MSRSEARNPERERTPPSPRPQLWAGREAEGLTSSRSRPQALFDANADLGRREPAEGTVRAGDRGWNSGWWSPVGGHRGLLGGPEGAVEPLTVGMDVARRTARLARACRIQASSWQTTPAIEHPHEAPRAELDTSTYPTGIEIPDEDGHSPSTAALARHACPPRLDRQPQPGPCPKRVLITAKSLARSQELR